MRELRRQSEVGNTLEFTNGRKLLLPPQPKGPKDKEVEPELRKPRERWNHGGEGALPEILHRAERKEKYPGFPTCHTPISSHCLLSGSS